jgi:hypothetical protein
MSMPPPPSVLKSVGIDSITYASYNGVATGHKGKEIPQSKIVGEGRCYREHTGWKWDSGTEWVLPGIQRKWDCVKNYNNYPIFRGTVRYEMRKEPYFTPIKDLGRGVHFGDITWFIPLKCQYMLTRTSGVTTTKTSLNVDRVYMCLCFHELHVMCNFASLPRTIRKAINLVNTSAQTPSAVKITVFWNMTSAVW